MEKLQAKFSILLKNKKFNFESLYSEKIRTNFVFLTEYFQLKNIEWNFGKVKYNKNYLFLIVMNNSGTAFAVGLQNTENEFILIYSDKTKFFLNSKDFIDYLEKKII